MSDCFLVRDWTGVPWDSSTQRFIGEPRCTIVHSASGLVKIIDDAQKNNQRICVYKIGECLLDWS